MFYIQQTFSDNHAIYKMMLKNISEGEGSHYSSYNMTQAFCVLDN